MANVKISQLASASTLTGSEEIPVVQNNATVKTTAQDIANLGGLGSVEIVADGSVGGPLSLQCNVSLLVPASISGAAVAPISVLPNINFSGSGGYGGGTFTATSLEFPTLEVAGDVQVYNTTTLQVLSAPELTEITGYTFTFSNNTALTTVDFPSLVKARSITFVIPLF